MPTKKYLIPAILVIVVLAAGIVFAATHHAKKVTAPVVAQVTTPTVASVTEPTKDPSKLAVTSTTSALPLVFSNTKLSFSYPNNWKICSNESTTVLAENYGSACPPLTTNTTGRFDFATTYKSALYTLQTVDLANGPSIGCKNAKDCIALVKTFTDISGLAQKSYNGHPAICFNWTNPTGTGTTWQIFFTDTDALTLTNNTSKGGDCLANTSVDAIFATVKAVK